MEAGKDRIAELVIEMQNGNSKAFDELYKLTSSRAYFVALQITKNEQDAEDILQESYVNAIAKINTLDKPESFVSWFHHIVANKSKDSLKKKKPTLFEGGEDEAFEIIPDEDTSFSPEENLNQAELQKAVMEVIGELTEEKRACVLMMYFEEMSVNEIAETLDVPVSTVKNRLFTARKDLKAKFEKRGITCVYSAAPIGVVIWALSKTADAVSKTFAGSQASAQVFAGITAASSATAATTAAAAGGTAAATTAASAGTGVAAKVAALTVAQKVAAGVAVTGIVTASAAGVATVVNINKEETTTAPTTAYVEEVTTIPTTLSTTAIMAIVQSETETSTTTEKTTEKTTVRTTERTTERTTVTTTAKPEPTATTAAPTTESTTEKTTKPKTTRKTTTRRDYSVYITSASTTTTTTTTTETTTRRRVTTTEAEEETTKAPETTTETTTEETTTTTTKAAPATVVINVYDLDDNVVATLNGTVEAGEPVERSYLNELITGAGYTPESGIYVETGETYSIGVTAESGETYRFRAEL